MAEGSRTVPNAHSLRAIAADEPGSVLLERAWSASQPGCVRLFRRPERVIEARTASEVLDAFASIEQALSDGLHVAGYFAYEAGFALEPALHDLLPALPERPLVWLVCVREPEVATVSEPAMAALQEHDADRIELSLSPQEYAERIDEVRRWIAAGSTYQANFTMEAQWSTTKSPLAMYERLLAAQPVRYAALLHGVRGHVISLSPELFFTRSGHEIWTRPMKGTAPRGLDGAGDRAQANWLAADEKNRSENLMIVDLLRNDLGRICCFGSVHVPRIFQVERYPSVLQMTSTVTGTLRKDTTYLDIFRALFPSGSIIGAPKIHTARLLHGVERRQRGVYTGAIGSFAPGGAAEFSVAIRTLTLEKGHARMGVGSGIVYDSEAESEYEECRTKTAFLQARSTAQVQIIETLLWQRGRFFLLRDHVDRMAASAEYFGYRFDEAKAQAALAEAVAPATHSPNARLRVRLLLSADGEFSATGIALGLRTKAPVRLLLSPEATDPADRFLRHKTTHRQQYDAALARAQSAGCDDALFSNTSGHLTECAIWNVLVKLDRHWITPPVQDGLLPGVYRHRLLRGGWLREQSIPLADLAHAEAILVCNSVRGLRRVSAIVDEAGACVWSMQAGGDPT